MLFCLRLLFAGLFCTLPSLVMANGCIDAPNRIYHDVKKYESTLSQHNFTWENLNWLQVQLGAPKVNKLDNNQIEYTWLCANDAEETLRVITDSAGRFIYVKGQYNLDSGSGIFEATINQQSIPVKPKKIVVVTTKTPATVTTATLVTTPPPAFAPTQTPPFPLSSTTSAANPAVCQNLVQQISDDIKKYNLDVNTQKSDLPWMNLSWLQLKLGPTSSTQAVEKLYTWNNFQFLQRATAFSKSFGVYPDNKQPRNVEEAIQTLGKPNSVKEQVFTKYVWRCTSENSSILEVYADEDNQLAYVTGNSCQGLCADFSVQLQPALSADVKLPEVKIETPPAPATPVPSPEVPTPPASFDQASINIYNQHYQTNFTDANQVQTNMIERMKMYYLNLRNCTPGENQLAVNMGGKPVFAVAEIKGKQNDLCMIQEGTQIGSQRIIKICNYEPRTLQFFTDPEATAIASGNTTFSSPNLAELQRAELTQCKIYINGVAV